MSLCDAQNDLRTLGIPKRLLPRKLSSCLLSRATLNKNDIYVIKRNIVSKLIKIFPNTGLTVIKRIIFPH